MIINYIKIVFRTIRRNFGFSFINILGLTIGITSSLLIFLYVLDETSYDKFQENFKHIYRVYSETQFPGGQIEISSASFTPLARVIKEECPEVEQVGRYGVRNEIVIKYEDNSYSNRLAYADPEILKMLTINFIKGTPESAFSDPFSIVISEKISQLYFGNEEAMGKILNIGNEYDVIVKGVFGDYPENSHFQFDCIIPFVNFWGPNSLGNDDNNWGGNPLETFVLLNKNSSYEDAETKILQAVLKRAGIPDGFKIKMGLQALSRIRLYSLESTNPVRTVYIVSFIAFIILLLSCINYINLSTAKSINRAREVGIRKVVGAGKKKLINQFLGESVVITLIALIIAIVASELLLGPFNKLAGKDLSLNFLDYRLWIGFFIIIIFTGILSGIYPAIVLSSYKPIKIIQGIKASSHRSPLRKILVIFQFVISVFFIFGTITISQQLKYIKTKNIGIKRNNLMAIAVESSQLVQNFQLFKDELLKNPNILNVSACAQNPLGIYSSVSKLDWEGKSDENYGSFNFEYVNYDYFETLGLEIIEGRSFSKEYPSDLTEGYIVNEEAVKLMDLESPVGKRFSMFDKEGKIIGVIKNHNFQTLHNEISPLAIGMDPGWVGVFLIRSLSFEDPESLQDIKKTWGKINPDFPFAYYFVEDIEGILYQTENRIKEMSTYAIILAIIISCLGLYGLSSFLTEQRTREIGIRKVFGASSQKITWLYLRQFFIWIILANIIAWPFAWYFMNKWLDNFVYHFNINWLIFILTGIITLFIAALTVIYHTIKTAQTNPAKILKYE